MRQNVPLEQQHVPQCQVLPHSLTTQEDGRVFSAPHPPVAGRFYPIRTMALVRISFGRLLASPLGSAGRTCKVQSLFSPQCASISSIHVPDRVKRPPPFPYKEKQYNLLRSLFDTTTDRFNENTKVIVVDGPIAAGKSDCAQKLAKELDMLYFPEANMDMLYINDYGYDMRQLDPELPESCRSYDVKDLNLRPNLSDVPVFQIQMYILRYSQYIDALGHVLSTGQGVVLDRCVYSDFVFLEALARQGFASKGACSVYYDIKQNTITELMRPHLVVYLDVPAAVVAERIKQRNIPYEVNSKLMNEKYLANIEELYKQRYLKEISTHAELLVYDWSNYGDIETVVEDIERVDFDCFGKYDPKMKDWRIFTTWEWNEARMKYTTDKHFLMNLLNVPRLDVPELLIDGHDAGKRFEVWNNVSSRNEVC
uniref:Deoxynucleoside kinase domain-containing protein n=2 Tax=Timema TaxID=61471 RepID=A0A7R9ELL0_9NEOP|nr:unnamed protein product [Timema bartmani]